MGNWKNITLHLTDIDLKVAFNKLSYLDIISVTIQDKRTLNDSDWYEYPNNPTNIDNDTHEIILLIDFTYPTISLIKETQFILGLKSLPKYNEDIFEDKDWVKFTQSQFKEILISKSLRVLPPWVKKTDFKGHSIYIEPGSGFGTGTHPTTKLCLRWIEQSLKKNQTVLDFGSGSGILSIAVRKITRNKILGVEIDQLAIDNANHNNKINGLKIKYVLSKHFSRNKKYDTVISNILASVLITLSEDFRLITKKELVLSGILISQKEIVIAKYKNWIDLKLVDKSEDWCLLHGKLKS